MLRHTRAIPVVPPSTVRYSSTVPMVWASRLCTTVQLENVIHRTMNISCDRKMHNSVSLLEAHKTTPRNWIRELFNAAQQNASCVRACTSIYSTYNSCFILDPAPWVFGMRTANARRLDDLGNKERRWLTQAFAQGTNQNLRLKDNPCRLYEIITA